MMFIFQLLLPTRHTKPGEAHVLVGDGPLASAVPVSGAPIDGAAAPYMPPAQATCGLTYYIDARLSEARFRID